MSNIKIDNKEYDLGTLSDECKAQLASIQLLEQELTHLKAQAAVLQTAKAAYLQALKSSLPIVSVSGTNSQKNSTNQNKIKSPSQIELNTLLEYYQKGQLEFAQSLATRLTQHYPNHPLGWKVLGSLYKQNGKLRDSINANQKVLEISPNDAEALSNLGNTFQVLGRLQEAEASHKKAIAIKPDYAEAHYNAGITLQELGRLKEAEASYKKALVINPDFAEAHYNLGISLKEIGRLAEAEASFTQAIRLRPNFFKAQNEMLNCLYLMDKKAQFIDELNYLITQDKPNSVVGSLTCRSALRYDEERPNIFCNEPLEYVFLVDLKSRYNFEEIFSRTIKYFLTENKGSNKRQSLLSNGYQTLGNLFDIENIFIDEIQKVIRSEIEKYRVNFENSQEGLIRKWPKNYSLHGWLISMKTGGELSPHIHEVGWLSGSIYINVPPKKNVDSGSLVVALGKDSDATNSRRNSKKVIDVVTGSMALFPASLMHHTIPFESEEERIVLAFDVIPKY
jgi:tetratricopeptide (TPR) repeat protein